MAIMILTVDVKFGANKPIPDYYDIIPFFTYIENPVSVISIGADFWKSL